MGSKLEKLIDDYNLHCINTGKVTHFSEAYETFSHIDLTIVHPNILQNLNWDTHDDLCSIDHYPIIKYILTNQIYQIRRPRWNIKLADWNKFRSCFEIESIDNIPTNNLTKMLTESLMLAAFEAIPMFQSTFKRTPVPWWSQTIYELIRIRKYCERRYKRRPCTENLIDFKLTKARARKEIRRANKQSWSDFIM